MSSPWEALQARARREYVESKARHLYALEVQAREQQDRVIRLRGLLDELGVLPGEIGTCEGDGAALVDGLLFTAQPCVGGWQLHLHRACSMCDMENMAFTVHSLTHLGEILVDGDELGCNSCVARLHGYT